MKRYISFILLIVMLFCMCSCQNDTEDNLDEGSIRTVGELGTLKCYYNNVVHIDKKADNIFQKDRKMWIEYEGIVTIGVDMSEVEIKKSGLVVEIKMPSAKVMDVEIDESTLNEDSFICSSDGFLFKNKITAEDQSNAIVQGELAMRKLAENNKGLLLQAEARAEELMANYIEKYGEAIGIEYIVNFK